MTRFIRLFLMGCLATATLVGCSGPGAEVATSLAMARSSLSSLASSQAASLGYSGMRNGDAQGDDCDDAGEPTREGVALDPEELEYAGRKLYCLMAKDSSKGSTFLGTLAFGAGVTCSIASQLIFDGVEREVEIPVESDCFAAIPNVFRQGSEEPQSPKMLKATVVATAPSAIQPELWERSVAIHFASGQDALDGIDAQLVVLHKREGTSIALAYYYGSVETGIENGYAFNLDSVEGVFRFEWRNQGYQAVVADTGSHRTTSVHVQGDENNRHGRVLARGQIGEDGRFAQVASLEAAYGELAKHATIPNKDLAKLITLKGSLEAGLRARVYKGQGDISLVANYEEIAGAKPCYSTVEASCDVEPGIELNADAQTAFLLKPGQLGVTTALEWFQSPLALLNYAAVTLAEAE